MACPWVAVAVHHSPAAGESCSAVVPRSLAVVHRNLVGLDGLLEDHHNRLVEGSLLAVGVRRNLPAVVVHHSLLVEDNLLAVVEDSLVVGSLPG